MSLFNNEFRLFFKKRVDIGGKSLSSPQTRVKTFRVVNDILTKTASTFEILQIPSAVEVGDIVGMYDAFGTIVYQGVVSELHDTTIESNQLLSLFDDEWLWNNPAENTIEQTLATIIETDFKMSNDSLLRDEFSPFSINTTSATNLSLPTEEEHYVVNLMSYLYDIYEKYNILLDINIPYDEEPSTIDIGKPNYEKLTISNNAYIFRNFEIITDVFETNKLIVYSEETGEYRETWYATTSGITDIDTALNRPPKIKTNIIFSDDPINILKASSLRNNIYNHRIDCDIVAKNKILNFSDLHLGQEVDIYYNGNYYNSILTGYQFEMNNGQVNELVHLTFGLVRTSLTSKLFKKLKA